MLFLGGNEHSVKVSSNSEMVRAGVLFENFGDYRELILIRKLTLPVDWFILIIWVNPFLVSEVSG